MSLREDVLFDDLVLDFSFGEVFQALSTRETRGVLPKWAIPYVEVLATTLSFPDDVPQYVVAAADAACRAHGYILPPIVSGLRFVASGGSGVPDCGMRNLRGFLEEWRAQLRQLRPAPQFVLRPA